MSDLQIIKDFHLAPNLDEMGKQIVIASQTDRIKDILITDLSDTITDSLSSAALIMGLTTLSKSPEDLAVMSKEITDKIRMQSPYEKLGEIKQAIKCGAYGEFKSEKDIIGLSPSKVFGWIKKYHEFKKEALSKQNKFNHQQKIELQQKEIESEKKQRYLDGLPMAIDSCKNNKSMHDNPMAWVYYDELKRLGLIQIENEEKIMILEKCREEVNNIIRNSGQNPFKIEQHKIENPSIKRAKEKVFYMWIQENKENDIKSIVFKALNNNENEGY